MTAKMNQAAEMWTFPPGFMTDNSGNLMKYAASVQMKLVQAGLDMQKDSFEFLQHRYGKDAQLATALMSAREPTEVMATCAEFLQDALDDYSREAVKFANFGAQFAVGAADQAGAEMEAMAEQMQTAGETTGKDAAPREAEAAANAEQDLPPDNMAGGKQNVA